jgi:phosphohistidine swiveling domain-containing protein
MMMIRKWSGFTSLVIASLTMSSMSARAAIADTNGEIIVGPSLGEDFLQPIRMAKATAIIFKQTYTTSPEGIPSISSQKVCEVSGSIPVIDARETQGPYAYPIGQLPLCETETAQGRVTIHPNANIVLSNNLLLYSSNDKFTPAKQFNGSIWLTMSSDGSFKFDNGSSASTTDLGLKNLTLSVSSDRITTGGGSTQMDENFTAMITYDDEGK